MAFSTFCEKRKGKHDGHDECVVRRTIKVTITGRDCGLKRAKVTHQLQWDSADRRKLKYTSLILSGTILIRPTSFTNMFKSIKKIIKNCRVINMRQT